MDTDVVTPFRPEGTPVTTLGIEAEPDTDAMTTTIDEVDQILDEVEAALTRLDDGTYGVCRDCGEPIDDARLSERPTGLTCAACEAGSPPSPAEVETDPAADPVEDPPAGPGPSPWSAEEFPDA